MKYPERKISQCILPFKNFLYYFFVQKHSSKDHLAQGNLLKTILLNEKQNNLEKEMCGNISLYAQHFSPGAGSNVHLTKTFSIYLLRSKKLNIKLKIFTCNTHSRLKLKSPKIKTFLFTVPKKQH